MSGWLHHHSSRPMIMFFALSALAGVGSATLGGNCSLPLHPGVRINGDDIMPKRSASSPASCCSLCTAQAGCKAFLWVKPSICWLKRAAEGPSECGDCVAGASALPPPGPAPPPAPGPGCGKDADCNGGGRCQFAPPGRGTCRCARGWAGEHCEQIKFGPAYACGAGGLCLNHTRAAGARGYADNFTSTWGGEAVQADDGSYHMYAASFGHDEALGSWLSNSRVVVSPRAAPLALATLTFLPQFPPAVAAEGDRSGSLHMSKADGTKQHGGRCRRRLEGDRAKLDVLSVRSTPSHRSQRALTSSPMSRSALGPRKIDWSIEIILGV